MYTYIYIYICYIYVIYINKNIYIYQKKGGPAGRQNIHHPMNCLALAPVVLTIPQGVGH